MTAGIAPTEGQPSVAAIAPSGTPPPPVAAAAPGASSVEALEKALGAGPSSMAVVEDEAAATGATFVGPSPAGVAAAGVPPATETEAEPTSPALAKRPRLRPDLHRTSRGFTVATGIGSLRALGERSWAPLARSPDAPRATALFPREGSAPTLGAETSARCEIVLPPRVGAPAASPGTVEVGSRSPLPTVEGKTV